MTSKASTVIHLPPVEVSVAGEYSAERLKELKKNTLRYVAPQPSEPVAGVFKLSGSFKPAGTTAAAVAVAVAGTPPVAAAEEADLPPPPRPNAARAAANPSPAGRGGTGAAVQRAPAAMDAAVAAAVVALDDDDDGFQIPNEETIRRAKEKRERLRSAHLAPDYIPLATASVLEAPEATGAAAARDDSDEDAEAEERVRMAFLGKAPGDGGGKGARGGGVLAGIAEDVQAEAEGEEDADDTWVREQLRKGAGRGAAGPAGPSAAPRRSTAAGVGFGGRGAAPAAAAAAAADEVVKALRRGVERLQATQAHAEKGRRRAAENLAAAVAGVGDLEAQLEAAGSRFAYLQQLRAYIADLCDMLQEKSALVEAMEEEAEALMAGRAEAAAKRGEEDAADDQAVAGAAVSAALAALSRGSSLSDATAAAESAAAEAEAAAAGGGMGMQLDELGRDLNMERRRTAAARAERRRARLQRDLQRLRQRQGDAEAPLGEETSDESESEVSRYVRKRRDLVDAARTVFADAGDEFGSLRALKARLEEWKGAQPRAYHDAYMGLSAPAVFAPFVRLELLAWDPLFGQRAGFDDQDWYQALFDYGQALPGDAGAQNGGAAPSADDDADNELIPRLVRELVLPRVTRLLAGAWNPASRRQSRAAAAVLQDAAAYVPPDDPALQAALEAALERLSDAVAALRLPPWPPAATAAAPQAAALLARRFGKALRLLRALGAFDGVLARGPLLSLALERLLHQQMLPYLRAAAADLPLAVGRMERLAGALRPEWFAGGPPPAAAPLLEYVGVLARALEQQRGSDASLGNGAAGGHAVSKPKVLAGRLAAVLAPLGDAARAARLKALYKL
ncbi:hypothetical protein WJX81_004262 [Elliptochloris bilobata]|uniref:GCF C-terminal domain-containing protein n=1 Tax=Elliptochloris bilobata TaxID=381761 RepID=A0AAW1RZP8_9CHLO